MREEKFLTLLSILGVALGIGLFIGVKVASDRAITSFESDVRGLDRQANYEVLDVSGVDFDETIYRNVRLLNEESMPALRADGFIPSWNREVVIEGIYTVRAMESAGTCSGRAIPPRRFFQGAKRRHRHKEICRGQFIKEGQ